MEINNFGLTGVNNSGAKEAPKVEAQANPLQNNPNAQVFQTAANQASVMARMNLKRKSDELNSNEEAGDAENIEMDIPGLGLVKVNKQKLKSFQARVGSAIYRQEEDIKQVIKQFASNDEILRSTISSILLAI